MSSFVNKENLILSPSSPLKDGRNTGSYFRGRKRGDLSAALSKLKSPETKLSETDRLKKELEDLRGKARLAAEMGQALLETNESLRNEKESLKASLDQSQRRLDQSCAQVSELVHDNDDLRGRVSSLMQHLRAMEASNAELVAENDRYRQAATHEQAQQEREGNKESELREKEEKALQELQEERNKQREMSGQLQKWRAEAERWKERATRLEQYDVPHLEEELRRSRVGERELQQLRDRVEHQEKTRLEQEAQLETLKQMVWRSDEWTHVREALVAQKNGSFFVDRDFALREVSNMLDSIPTTTNSGKSQHEELVKFLTEHLPQSTRWLVMSSFWRSFASARQVELQVAQRDVQRLRQELEVLETQQKQSQSQSQSQQQQQVQVVETMEMSLAQAMQEDELEVMREELQESRARWDAEREQLLELVKPYRANLEHLQVVREQLQDAKQEIEHLTQDLEKARSQVASEEVLKEVETLKEEISAQKMIADEGRRRIAELLMHNNVLQAALRKIDDVSESANNNGRRLSDVVPPQAQLAKLASDPRTKSYADFGSWLPHKQQSKGEERQTVGRVLTLEKNLKEASFQRDKYDKLFRLATMRCKKLEEEVFFMQKENQHLRDEITEFENTPVAEDLKLELFYSLSLSVKLSLAAAGHPAECLNRNVNDLYEEMERRKWMISEWPAKILAFFK